eukprot:70875-Chlamydomonas_euryale.AAC.1
MSIVEAHMPSPPVCPQKRPASAAAPAPRQHPRTQSCLYGPHYHAPGKKAPVMPPSVWLQKCPAEAAPLASPWHPRMQSWQYAPRCHLPASQAPMPPAPVCPQTHLRPA